AGRPHPGLGGPPDRSGPSWPTSPRRASRAGRDPWVRLPDSLRWLSAGGDGWRRGRGRLGRDRDDAKGGPIGLQALQKGKSHVVHGHAARGLALGLAAMGVAVEHDARGIAVERLLEPARAEERIDLAGLSVDGVEDGSVVE